MRSTLAQIRSAQWIALTFALTGCGPGLMVGLAGLPTTVGMVGATSLSFQVSLAASSTLTCRQDGLEKNATLSGNWYQLNDLSPGTTYSMECSDGIFGFEVTGRTLLKTAEPIATSSAIVQSNGTFLLTQCFGQARRLSYHPITGELEIFGQSSGSVTQAPNTCYARYDGTTWSAVRLDYPGEVVGTTIDYNAGGGFKYLPDGTRIGRDTVSISGTLYSRFLFCSTDCLNKDNWSTLVFNKLASNGALPNACQADVALNPDGSKLILVNSCGGDTYSECSLTSDCTQIGNWSTPAYIGTVGSGINPEPFWDSAGTTWFSSNTYSVFYCKAGFDCTLPANWHAGYLSGLTGGAGHIYTKYRSKVFFEESNGTLRFVVSRDGAGAATQGLTSGWGIAQCSDANIADCATVDGSNFLTHFTASTLVHPPGELHRAMTFSPKIGGYDYRFQDSATGNYTRFSTCDGDFDTCFGALSNWSSYAPPLDGLDHAWAIPQERGAFVDSSGLPAFYDTSTFSIHYFR